MRRSRPYCVHMRTAPAIEVEALRVVRGGTVALDAISLPGRSR